MTFSYISQVEVYARKTVKHTKLTTENVEESLDEDGAFDDFLERYAQILSH